MVMGSDWGNDDGKRSLRRGGNGGEQDVTSLSSITPSQRLGKHSL